MIIQDLTDQQKTKLIEALKQEYDNVPDYSVFGTYNHKEQYAPTIKYIQTGEKHPNPSSRWDLYDAVLFDLETLLSDYDIV